jgi:hypothetical protein
MKSKSWCSPGQLLMLMLAGWINRHQQAVIAWPAQLLLPRSRVKLGRSNNGTLRHGGYEDLPGMEYRRHPRIVAKPETDR